VTLPDRWSPIRINIVNGIKAIPGWPRDVEVRALGIPQDAFFQGWRRGVGVCLSAEDEWQSIDKGLNDRLDQPAEMNVPICIYSYSEASPAGALEARDGGIDTLASLLLGSNVTGYTRGIRSVDIGIPFETGGVYLRAVKTQLIPEQKRAEGSGGGLVKVIMFRTTTLPL
jgi:hypothetical protein